MKEFRKARIQREVAEILATIDQTQQPPQTTTLTIRRRLRFHPRHIGLAFLFCLLTVLMIQNFAMEGEGLETAYQNPYQFTPVAYPESRVDFGNAAFPELPEIELIYIPNFKPETKVSI